MKNLLPVWLLCLPLSAFADDLVSCWKLADELERPGFARPCAPLIIDGGTAADAATELQMRRIAGDWYIVRPADYWSEISYKSKWKMLSLGISAIQGLHGNADLYLIVDPIDAQARHELAFAIEMGSVPTQHLVGEARYRLPADLFKPLEAPPNHHKRAYVMAVH